VTVAAQSSYLHGPIDMTPEQRAELSDWRAFYRKIEREYRIGEREYVALYEAQGGRCYVCSTAKGRDPRRPLAWAARKRKPRRLGVDHNHETGEVRALVCTGSLNANTCNRLIARYSRAQLVRAVQMLSDPPPARAVLVALVRDAVPARAYRYGKQPGVRAPLPTVGPGCVCDATGRPCPRHGVVV
jgi:hypothetical protein